MVYKKNYVIIKTLVISLILSAILLLFSSALSPNMKGGEHMTNYNVYALKPVTNVSFAGEKAPLHRWYVKESLDREMLVNTYWQSQTLLFLKRAYRYFPLIERILKRENVPDDVKYIALIESGLLPNAVSPASAVGMWQFIKDTGKEYGLEINDEVDERYHLEKATVAACEYLKDAKEIFGSWTLAAACYNAGKRGIHKQMERQNASNYYDLLLGEETGRYVYRILALKTIMKNPLKYGFRFSKEDLYKPIPTHKVLVNTPIDSWVDWAVARGFNYNVLKILNPWLRDVKLTNEEKKEYYIDVPNKGVANFRYSTYQ